MTKSLKWLVLLVVYLFLLRFFSAWMFNHINALSGIVLMVILFFTPIYYLARKIDIFNNKGRKNEEV